MDFPQSWMKDIVWELEQDDTSKGHSVGEGGVKSWVRGVVGGAAGGDTAGGAERRYWPLKGQLRVRGWTPEHRNGMIQEQRYVVVHRKRVTN